MKLASRLLVVLAVALAANGCWMLSPPPLVSPLALDYPPGLSLTEAGALIMERAKEVDTFGAQAGVVIKPRRLPHKEDFLVTVRRREPDKLLIRAHKGMSVPVFRYVQTPELVAIYFEQEQLLFVGSPADLQKADSPLAEFDPSLLVRALMAETVLAEALAPEANAAWKERRNNYLLQGKIAGYRVDCYLQKSDLLARRIVLRDEQGRKIGRADYGQYALTNGLLHPMELRVIDYTNSSVTNIVVHDETVMVDTPFPDRMFDPNEWPLPANTKVYPLSELIMK